MSNSIPVITIDGPSGSGKGTVGRLLADRLGWHYLDSGALYRVLAYAAILEEIALTDTDTMCALAHRLPVSFDVKGTDLRVMLGQLDVTKTSSGEDVGGAASQIAVEPTIRAALLARQRDFQQSPGLVTDGRDMGTVVFPQAKLKLFLDADLEKRSQRRYKQLQEKGIDVTLQQVFQDLARRDERDRNRIIAPLKPAADAILIDSTELTVIEVFEQVSVMAESLK